MGKKVQKLDKETGKIVWMGLADYFKDPDRYVDVPHEMTSEAQLTKISKDLVNQTQPLRDRLINQSLNFLDKNFDVTKNPQYRSALNFANQQAKTAKDSILSTLPSGGVLLDKLADVDIEKSRALESVGAGIYSDELGRAMSLATGTPFQSGMSGLGGLAQMDLARNQANAAKESEEKNTMGSAFGTILGAYLGGPSGAAAGAQAGGKV